MSPVAPLLATDRDTPSKRGRAKAGSTVYYWVPPGTVEDSGNLALAANVDEYAPLWLPTSIVVDQFATEVTSAVGTNFRIGMYRADANWQPIGAPVIDSGNLSSASTGVKTYTPGTPVFLRRGLYVEVINADNAPSVRGIRGASGTGWAYDTTIGTTGIHSFTVGRTYAAFPTPGTAWTTVTVGNYGPKGFIFFRILTP